MQIRTSVAYHEAGHAAIAAHYGIRPVKVALVSGQGYSGIFNLEPGAPLKKNEWPMPLKKKNRIEVKIMVSLAGGLAQRIHKPRGYRPIHDQRDRMEAFDLASQITEQRDDEAHALVSYFTVRTRNLLEDPSIWGGVDALAKELLQVREVSGKRAKEIVLAAEAVMIE